MKRHHCRCIAPLGMAWRPRRVQRSIRTPNKQKGPDSDFHVQKKENPPSNWFLLSRGHLMFRGLGAVHFFFRFDQPRLDSDWPKILEFFASMLGCQVAQGRVAGHEKTLSPRKCGTMRIERAEKEPEVSAEHADVSIGKVSGALRPSGARSDPSKTPPSEDGGHLPKLSGMGGMGFPTSSIACRLRTNAPRHETKRLTRHAETQGGLGGRLGFGAWRVCTRADGLITATSDGMFWRLLFEV